MNDTQLAEATTEDQQKELLQQLINSFNPKDFMTPSQIEIAELSPEQLNNEYALVQSKSNIRSRGQRDLIVSRWAYEQSKTVANEAPVKTKSKKKTADKVSAKA
jgi:pyridoxal/pyridoxine/pyridoxamine kinase